MIKARRFISDDKGAVTIEFTTLVPAFVMLFVFFVDASIVYLTHSEMWNVARDIARRMSTEQITTMDEVRDYAVENLLLGQRGYYVSADFTGDKSVTIVVGVDEAAIFGFWFRPILGRELLANAVMSTEPARLNR